MGLPRDGTGGPRREAAGRRAPPGRAWRPQDEAAGGQGDHRLRVGWQCALWDPPRPAASGVYPQRRPRRPGPWGHVLAPRGRHALCEAVTCLQEATGVSGLWCPGAALVPAPPATAGPPAQEPPLSKGHLTLCLSKHCFLCSSATGLWCRRMEEEGRLAGCRRRGPGRGGPPRTRTRLSLDRPHPLCPGG